MDKNSLFEIPTADITVMGYPKPAQWEKVPSFVENDKSSNPASNYSFNQVKLAVNSTKTVLYIFAEVNGIISASPPPYYIINISNDYSCTGYSLQLDAYLGGNFTHYYLCTNVDLYTVAGKCSSTGGTSSYFEIDLPLNGNFSIFRDTFIISIYSSSTAMPAPTIDYGIKNSYIHARWVKIK